MIQSIFFTSNHIFDSNVDFFPAELPGLPRQDQAGGLARDSGQWGGCPGISSFAVFWWLSSPGISSFAVFSMQTLELNDTPQVLNVSLSVEVLQD